jgi:three-Cys-motif partner protein
MPLPDSANEKWVRKEHTAVKHEILKKYLTPWTQILASGFDRIHYFDGFAGRGRYEDGEPGSPVLAMRAADKNAQDLDEFLCTFVELNDENFEDLESVIEDEKQDCTEKISIITENAKFENVVDEIIEELNGNEIVPSFFFVDPFGYEGMPFEAVADIINLREEGVEVFLTYMVRDIRRFLTSEDHEDSITRILGTDEWKQYKNSENKEEEVLKLYERQLRREADVDYVWPFEMKMPKRSETVYYLIHATNHFKGFKIMKDIMYNTGAEDRFAYLGPDHYAYEDEQTSLFDISDTSDSRVDDLAEFLFEQLEGKEMSFFDVMKQTYEETDLIEKHYREAIYYLEDHHKAKIQNRPNKHNGTKNGLGHDDVVIIERENFSLENFHR